MNWKEINKKYPKVTDLYVKWFAKPMELNITKESFLLEADDLYDTHNHFRDLYDFFDGQRMKCLVTEYGYIIIDTSGISKVIDSRTIHADFDRILIEKLMFEKAFEILENKLSNGNN